MKLEFSGTDERLIEFKRYVSLYCKSKNITVEMVYDDGALLPFEDKETQPRRKYKKDK